MAKYDYLEEMRIRFANPQLKSFVAEGCLSPNCRLNLELDNDMRVGFADYILRKSLANSHKTHSRIELLLKESKIPGSTFAIHYDTLLLQLVTWKRFSLESRLFNQIISGELIERESANSITNCLTLFSVMSQMTMFWLLSSGSDDGAFAAIDKLVKMKVDVAFEKNQTMLMNSARERRDCRALMANLLTDAMIDNSKDSFRFALERWELSSKDRKQFIGKLEESLKTKDRENIVTIFSRAIELLEPEIDDLYREIITLHSKVFVA